MDKHSKMTHFDLSTAIDYSIVFGLKVLGVYIVYVIGKEVAKMSHKKGEEWGLLDKIKKYGYVIGCTIVITLFAWIVMNTGNSDDGNTHSFKIELTNQNAEILIIVFIASIIGATRGFKEAPQKEIDYNDD